MRAEAGAAARIGPNAVTRVAEALATRHGPIVRDAVFARAGLRHHLADPPRAMVPDGDVARLHAALHAVLGPTLAGAVGREAGELTGRYLLAHRIPRPLRVLLALLPRRLALRVLLAAIGRHAWTFVGAGRFEVAWAPLPTLVIAGGPVSRSVTSREPACAYCGAVFESLFRDLVDPRTRVVEFACEAVGAPACRFAVRVAEGAPGLGRAGGRPARVGPPGSPRQSDRVSDLSPLRHGARDRENPNNSTV
ncbi:bacteriochlorophyll 4-vinyl reductase [Methylobacterium sp. 4-46]|uniref:bacteriochlorophyll 4-vinyl reductase n=1 Tax=unclassified Methylobacterium TaxID=2615210 RepID=UPI000165C5FE|nr:MULTISPECIES: bacteriochlorophyll 4-vinyl reductase [Methylobacterium]ACA17965.1 bacteriochlorophyll 4-vinyl reductase [Methylobacterium sp. 4-46]WFT77267.1 bacteriochlorophyll 4-vinyl reductase [Methylobacterium nodulans]